MYKNISELDLKLERLNNLCGGTCFVMFDKIILIFKRKHGVKTDHIPNWLSLGLNSKY